MVRRRDYPEPGELVICTAERITQNAAWCRLDEYPKLEGMVHVTESSGRWVLNIKDSVKPKKQYVAKVLSINPETKDINLSLKRVSRHDEKRKLVQYRKEQGAENILRQVAKSLGKSLDEAYEEAGFLLQEQFGELSTAFDEIKDDSGAIDSLGIKNEWEEAIINVVNKMLASKKIILKAEMDLKCYSGDGVEIIKNNLSALEEKGFRVKYISAPKYTVEMTTNEPKKAEKEMRNNLDGLVDSVRSSNGEASYKFIR